MANSPRRKRAPWQEWFGARFEYLLEVQTADGPVVIRTRPDAGIVTIFEVPYRISVRRRSNDPFGKPVWVEHARGRRQAIVATEELARRLRAGETPWLEKHSGADTAVAECDRGDSSKRPSSP